MRSARPRLVLLGMLLAAVSVWLLLAGGPSSGDVQGAVDRGSWLAPVVFIAIYVAWTVALLPGVVPTLASGALFGVFVGTLLTLIGAVIGATVAFLIGRRLGRAQVETLAGERAVRFEQWICARGTLALLYVRLVPIVPFSVLNYAAGLTRISTRRYVIATAVGIVPGTVAYTALGSAAGRPGSMPFIVSLAAVALLTLIVGVLSRRRRSSLAGR